MALILTLTTISMLVVFAVDVSRKRREIQRRIRQDLFQRSILHG
jgi:hypothetical protein